MTLALLRETGGWIAVDKPAGLATIPARGEDPASSAWRRLERERGERLWVVHRLDRDTSGVLLFARTAAVHRSLSTAFASGGVRKTYLAFVRGEPAAASGSIDVALHAARKGKMRPAAGNEPGSLAATTGFRAVSVWRTPLGPVSLLEVSPRTGRQHQIRVHLRFAGVPLLVDPLYGRAADRPDAAWIDRLTLHASRLTFDDPETSATAVVEAPLPPDLRALRERLAAF